MAIDKENMCYEFRKPNGTVIGRFWVENDVIQGDNPRLVRGLRRICNEESFDGDVISWFWNEMPDHLGNAYMSIHGVSRDK